MLHGKKDIFLEKTVYDDSDEQNEKEADDFAAKCLRSSRLNKNQ
ncbi:hypothetical protein [Pedobacter hartonius]